LRVEVRASSKRRERRGRQSPIEVDSQDDPADAITDQGDVEIDEQPQPLAGELEICEHLSLVDGEQPLYGLEFNDDAAVDQGIDAKSCIDLKSVVQHRKHELTLSREFSLSELVEEASFVDVLK